MYMTSRDNRMVTPVLQINEQLIPKGSQVVESFLHQILFSNKEVIKTPQYRVYLESILDATWNIL